MTWVGVITGGGGGHDGGGVFEIGFDDRGRWVALKQPCSP